MSISKRNIVFIFVLILSTVVLDACGSLKDNASEDEKSDSNEVVLRVSNTFGEDHPQNKAMEEKFKPMIEEGTNGEVKVEIYENSKLGDEKEVYDGVRNGSIEMVIAGTIMSDDVPKMSIGDWPFLFKDLNHAKKVLNGSVGDEVKEQLEEESNTKLLAWSANGFRMFSSNKPINNMDDLKGQKIRLPDIDNFVNMGNALGINVTNLPFDEVFTSLEQNVVNGQDNPISTLRANGWYEVQDYVLESRHVFSLNSYLINGDLWDGLSEDHQKVIKNAAEKTADYEWELTEASYEEDKEFLENEGIEFIEPTEDFIKEFEDAMIPFYEDIYNKYPWAEEIVNSIKKEE